MNCTILKYKNEADIIRNKRMASCVFYAQNAER
ncbi:hypothetical protein J2T26_000172 [Citrobacter farmeri]|nr:hypothetical protein [Citrobacter farmeri]MCW2423784.1 hypothetical protein [Citrobacter farmeri]